MNGEYETDFFFRTTFVLRLFLILTNVYVWWVSAMYKVGYCVLNDEMWRE